MDDFEEVVIPCFVEPKKLKGRPSKDAHKYNTKKGKRSSSTGKAAKQQVNTTKTVGNRTKATKTSLNKPSGKRETQSGIDQKEIAGKNLTDVSGNQRSTEINAEESGPDDPKADIVMGSQSAVTPLQSEPCNDSYCGAELNTTSVDTLAIEHEVTDKRNSDSEEQEDDGNSDIDHDGYEEEEDEDDFNDGDGVDFIDDNDIECDINSDGKTDMDTETSGCDSDGNALSTAAVPAKNLQRSQDGHVVLLWTR